MILYHEIQKKKNPHTDAVGRLQSKLSGSRTDITFSMTVYAVFAKPVFCIPYTYSSNT